MKNCFKLSTHYSFLNSMTKEFNENGRTDSIKQLIHRLTQDFINTSSPSSKMGGLIAVSSVAIALDKDAKCYLEEIIKPIFECAYDVQKEVRYRSLEALYNVVKCVRNDILVYMNEIFDILVSHSEDNDSTVQEAAKIMDKLMKDIIIENPTLNVASFIDLIRQRIYALTPNTRKLILSWIDFLISVPDIDLVIFIQDILEGLLKIACDTNKDIRFVSETILCKLYDQITEDHEQVDFKPLIKILLMHVQTDSYLVQNITLKWLNKFIGWADRTDVLNDSAHILAAILPCLSYARVENASDDQDDNKNLQKRNNELAKSISGNLMNLVTKSVNAISNQKTDESFAFENDNFAGEDCFSISKILIVLLNELELGPKTSTQTKLAILKWFLQIYSNLTVKIDENLESKMFTILLISLKDPSDEVVTMDLKVLNKIIKSSNDAKSMDDFKKCKKLLENIVDMFHENSHILKDRGPFIIRQLCTEMNSRTVYISFAEIMLVGYDKSFIQSLVYILNTILLTSQELSDLRHSFKSIAKDQSSLDLFLALYKTWCYSPVSVISLCLLTKCYKLAFHLILYFGDMDITIDILMQIDQLIQLLESPIYTGLLTLEHF